MPYLQKIMYTDSKIRVYTYQNQVPSDFEQITRVDYTKREEGTKRDDSIQRTRDKLHWLIRANATKYTKMLTLTHKNPVHDYEESLKHVKAFKRNYKRIIGYIPKALYVAELHPKGHGWHWHVILFNHDSYIPKTLSRRLWPYGFVLIKAVYGSDVARYLMKYITKESQPLNKKGYLRSGNLEEPETIQTMASAPTALTPTFEKSWSLYHGNYEMDSNLNQVDYSKFNMCTMKEYIINDETMPIITEFFRKIYEMD